MAKASATLDGVPLAGTGPVVWRLQTGVVPFTAVYTVHRSNWDRLKEKRGQLLTLQIVDGRGSRTKVEGVTILHEVPSDSPHRRSFMVADRRWTWGNVLVCRDYNATKRTGERKAPGGQAGDVPEILVTVDEFKYRAHSLRKGKERWKAKQIVQDVLGIVCRQSKELNQQVNQKSGGNQGWQKPFLWVISSWPIREKDSGSDDLGEFTIQNLMLRDSGDAALSRVLSYVPGAQVYIDLKGRAVIFDGTDLQATRAHFQHLPPAQYGGDAAIYCDRSRIRPRDVLVHYQREIEILLDYQDDLGPTAAGGNDRDEPYLQNVLPTADLETTFSERDPETNENVSKTVKQGTWVPFDKWLAVMNSDKRPEGSADWTFDTIRKYWIHGGLEGVLGGNDARGTRDILENADVSMRIQAIRQHFRQTFRINRRYMERIREIKAVRVGLLDPVTGARAPASVWGQACLIPSNKGSLIAHRKDPNKAFVYINVDQYPKEDENVLEKIPSPALVEIVDAELGIIRINWQQSPYGVVADYLPCLCADSNDTPTASTRNLGDQEVFPMGPGMRIEGGTNALMLAKKFKFKIMLTIVPAAPNNARQLHQIRVGATDVAQMLAKEYTIQGGYAPPLELFIAPSEATARFALTDPTRQDATLDKLLGLNVSDEQAPSPQGPAGANPAGIPPGEKLDGYTLMNERIELKPHAQSVAVEMLAREADDVMGRVTTVATSDEMKLVGSMNSVTIAVATAPSGRVTMHHEFPGKQRPISRMALLPDSARQALLGTLPFGK